MKGGVGTPAGMLLSSKGAFLLYAVTGPVCGPFRPFEAFAALLETVAAAISAADISLLLDARFP